MAEENVGFHCAGNDGSTAADAEISVVQVEEKKGGLTMQKGREKTSPSLLKYSRPHWQTTICLCK